jgi:hypothetical protein
MGDAEYAKLSQGAGDYLTRGERGGKNGGKSYDELTVFAHVEQMACAQKCNALVLAMTAYQARLAQPSPVSEKAHGQTQRQRTENFQCQIAVFRTLQMLWLILCVKHGDEAKWSALHACFTVLVEALERCAVLLNTTDPKSGLYQSPSPDKSLGGMYVQQLRDRMSAVNTALLAREIASASRNKKKLQLQGGGGSSRERDNAKTFVSAKEASHARLHEVAVATARETVRKAIKAMAPMAAAATATPGTASGGGSAAGTGGSGAGSGGAAGRSRDKGLMFVRGRSRGTRKRRSREREDQVHRSHTLAELTGTNRAKQAIKYKAKGWGRQRTVFDAAAGSVITYENTHVREREEREEPLYAPK